MSCWLDHHHAVFSTPSHPSVAADKSMTTQWPYQDAETEINDKKATWVFENIPYGDYSIRLFHDENGNKILDKGLFGLPKEPYGYSNNARGRLSAPKWEDAKFKLDVEQVISPIEVK